MKNVKRSCAFLLVLAFSLTLLVGCSKEEEQNSAGTISDFESQAHIQVSTPDNESVDTSREPITGDFVVSEKRYSYEGTDLMVLYVENKTNRHYNVTIHGTYLDENGEKLKEESQTFEGFASEWQNYFVFRPKMDFDRFEYTLETEEYTPNLITSDKNGVPYTTNIELFYEKKLHWVRALSYDDPPKEARDLCLDFTLVNHHPEASIAVEFYLLVLDKEGQMYFCSKGNTSLVSDICGTACTPVGGEDNGKFKTPTTMRRQLLGEDETIPDNVQGVLTAIFAIVDVVDIDEFLSGLS